MLIKSCIVKVVKSLLQGQSSKYFATMALKTMTDPLVTVQHGQLRGAVKLLLNGSSYYSFKGIPYAQPPVGNLRFADPQPLKPWNGTYDAIEHGPVCPQVDMITRKVETGDENCLFLNVYTKSLQLSSKQPVMVFIHGGGYMSGSGDTDLLGPEFLIQHDVILVTLNYRLEALGFLCLDTPEVPGNAGMKDQVFALRWVKQNIEQFGGDPNNVTIFGESAGATSTLFHVFSPMSKGLFHKAIAQSGVPINEWAYSLDSRDRAFRVGKVLGIETNDTTKLLDSLRSEPVENLPKLTFSTMTTDEKHRGLPMYFCPVVEKKFDNVEPFLLEHPVDQLLSKKLNDVPLLLGYTSSEGLIMVADYLRRIDFVNANPQYLVPREIALKVSETKVKEFGDRIMRFYFGDKIRPEDKQKIANLASDRRFTYNIHRFAYFYASLKPTYLYRFSLETELNIFKNFTGTTDLEGACHVDDLFYMFYNEMNKDIYENNEKLRNIVNNVTKLWTDFAKTGNPTPDGRGIKWPQYTSSTKDFLDINDPMTPGRYPNKQNVEFWNKMYIESGLPAIAKSNL